MIDNYLTISKLILYTCEKRTTSLGPSASMKYGTPVVEYGLECPMVCWNDAEKLCIDFYKTKEDEVPVQNALYAARDFFDNFNHQVFQKCIELPQAELGKKRYADLWKNCGKKDVTSEFGAGIFIEEDGVIAIEAEYAMECSENAYLTNSKDGRNIIWSHLQAETNSRTGFAMHVAVPGLLWEEPEAAPAMHYRISIGTPGSYCVWMLIRHHDGQSDSCYLSLDGMARPLSEQFGKGKLHTYNTAQVYYWCLMSELELSKGEHVFSVLARKSQLRVDRIYLTRGNELPPIDAQWVDSVRR